MESLKGSKYKRLSNEELQALEKEFINFLSSMQITGSDWEKMKKNEVEKAEELIAVFSDVVYDKVLTKIKFLEYRDQKTLNLFRCMDDKIALVGLRVKEHSSLDLTAPDIFSQWTNDNTSSINVIKTEKNYMKERGVEIFELLQTGCLITDDKLFNLLMGMV
ncbi:MAG: DUF6495 family protein [Bacteroidetes bacterium]|nr:DUF6495 family protein [Bacteroidota bacterium]